MNCPRCGPTMGPYCPDCDLCQKCCAEECDEPPSPAPRGTSEAEIGLLVDASISHNVDCDTIDRWVPGKPCNCGADASRRQIKAHVAHLAAQRDEALTWKERFSQAHAAGYAAAREEAAKVCVSRADSLSSSAMWTASNEAEKCAMAIRALPSPASPEPKEGSEGT